jgi:hypothetical protein
MAWSEAARKAALEARRLHKKAKLDPRITKLGGPQKLSRDLYYKKKLPLVAEPEVRASIAAQVRAFRKTGQGDGKAIMAAAWNSTVYRNAARIRNLRAWKVRKLGKLGN